jgi:hypothetical protein
MKEIALRNQKKQIVAVAIVDDESLNEIGESGWHLCAQGYAAKKVNRRQLAMHRFVCNAKPGDVVDHINHNILDNRKSNLRITTLRGNAYNTSMRSTNQNGHMGIYKHSTENKWCSEITIAGKKKWLGYYDTKDEAADSYQRAKIERDEKYFQENV